MNAACAYVTNTDEYVRISMCRWDHASCVYRSVYDTHACMYTGVLRQVTHHRLLPWFAIFTWAMLARLEARYPSLLNQNWENQPILDSSCIPSSDRCLLNACGARGSVLYLGCVPGSRLLWLGCLCPGLIIETLVTHICRGGNWVTGSWNSWTEAYASIQGELRS